MLGLEERYAAAHRRLDAKVYLCVGSDEVHRHDMVDDLETFAARLRQRKYDGLALSSRVWQDETHNSIFPLCLSTGLRFVHDGR